MKTMPRRVFLSLLGSISGAVWVGGTRSLIFASDTSETPWPRFGRSIVIDSASGWPGEPGKPDSMTAAALDDVRKSGLTAINLTVNGAGIGSYANNYNGTMDSIAYWNGQVAAHPDALMQVRRFADIAEAKRTGRLGLIYGLQDSFPFGEDLDRLDQFVDFGLRIFSLTYNKRNLVGDGCLEAGNAGLSEFGLKLVAALNEHKLLIDLAHAGERTTLEAITASKAPIAISHTGCAALNPNPRNKTDNELRKLAEKGGYVGIYLMPFLRGKGQPMAADLVAHLEHAIDICGEDHVGIGGDIPVSPTALTPEFKKKHAEFISDRRKRGIAAPGEDPDVYMFLPDLNRADRLARLAQLLSQRTHSDARIEKILGGNFARLLHEVWGD